MMEPAAVGSPLPRAFLHVGGATLARHQLGLALAFECQRIICIARDVSRELIALQHAAEEAGARLHVVPGPRALGGLVTANDELIVFNEGLLATPREAIALLEQGHGVLVQPIESGLAGGFERIDINHAAAGMMRIPGRLVERLADLPADVDVPSSLARIALQAGIATRMVPATAREGVRWRLVHDEGEAHAIEPAWIRLHMGEGSLPTPGMLLSRLGVVTFGPSLLHAGSSARLVGLGALVVLLMALGAGWFGYIAVGLVFCALAWTIRSAAGMLQRVEQDSLNRAPSIVSAEQLADWLVDATIMILAIWSSPALRGGTFPSAAFAPFILLCLVRLLPKLLLRGWTSWLQDRALLALLLAIAAAFGYLIPAIQVLAATFAAAGLLLSGGQRLTGT